MVRLSSSPCHFLLKRTDWSVIDHRRVLIILMIFYWAIARLVGFDHPLGNLELGKIVGNDAWNDTKTYYNPVSNSTDPTNSTETESSTSSLLSSTTSGSTTLTSTAQAAKLTLSSTATEEEDEGRGSLTGSITSSMQSRTGSALTSEPTVTGVSHSTFSELD